MNSIAIVNVSDNKKFDLDSKISFLKNMLPEYDVINYCNGTDTEGKIDDLISAYNDDSVSYILCSNGGTTSVELLSSKKWVEFLDGTKSLKNKKCIVGFSDCDHLLLELAKMGYNTANGLVLKHIDKIDKDRIIRFFFTIK